MELALILAAGVALVLALMKISRVIASRRIADAGRPQAAAGDVPPSRPGARAPRDVRPGARTSTSAAHTAPYTSSAWDIPAMSSITAPSEPTGLETTVIGGGGGFSVGGASGGWESASCGPDSPGGGDSGSSCSSSGGGD